MKMSASKQSTHRMPAMQGTKHTQQPQQKKQKPLKRLVFDRTIIEDIHFDRVKGIAGG
ncbi:MAG: hypothetical protein H6673_07495 [Anaerolineales bacterium]|nr:hypothetical protein [Anaerolineales bacterium]